MGAWGVGLYQDDVACDIKEEYINRLKIMGQTNIEATEELIEGNEDYFYDEEDGPVSWFALADTQWRYGRLLPEVKDIAIKLIKEEIDLERWKEDEKQYEKRKEVLNKLMEKLNSPQPPEKKISKRKLIKAQWEKGDVVLYQLTNEKVKDSKWYNKYVLFRVLCVTKTNIGSLPREYSNEQNVIAYYNWVGNAEPDLSIIKELKFLKTTRSYGKAGKWYTRVENVMSILSITEREAKRFKTKVIMKDPKYKNPPEKIANGLMIGWSNIDQIDKDFVREFKIEEEKGILKDETK